MDIHTLSGLLFGFDIAFGERSLSRTNDMDWPPRILPLEIGDAIKAAYPDWAEHYHIINYDKWCELWPLKQWRDSSSFHHSLKGTASIYFKARELHFSLHDAIKKRTGITDVNLLATIVAAIETDVATPQLIEILKLKDIIAMYKEKSK